MSKIYFLLFILFFILPSKLFSQVNVSGQITDKNNKSIEFLEIQLQNKDSVIVKSELTNVDGKFTIIAEKGEYQLLIKQLGKILQKQKVSANQDIYIGVIQVAENQQQLKEVVITSKKKLIERKVDRLIFNVENSISASGGDVIDALKITPSIRVQNDQISMIGKNQMGVMIDDRLIQLSDEDLINYLKTIKSDDIKSIEVINNPSAKYDAEGNSGIINIKLKRATKDSFNGNLKTSYTQAKYALGNVGGAINYQKGKTTFTSNMNYSNGSIAPYQEYTILYPNYSWFEENKKRTFQNNLSGRLALDYQLSKKTTIGLQYTLSNNKPIKKGANTSFIKNNISNQLDSIIITPSHIDIKKISQSINFHSITKLDTIGKKISFDADYFNFDSNLNNNFSSNSYLPNGQEIPNHLTSANNLSKQNINIYTSKVDVELPLKWTNLSFGAKISYINNDSKVLYFNTNNQPPILISNKSNLFNYLEETQALYISGSKSLSEKWEIQIGLRIERTKTKGFSETLNQTNIKEYTKPFPTFYLTYKLNENNTFSLNYNRRIDRPTYNFINPFRFYSTSFNYTEGNPFLQPFFTDNIEISHTYKNLNSSIYFNYLKNGFDQVTFISSTSSVQAVIPYNFYTQKTLGFVESYTLNKWQWWESNNQLNIFYSKTISDLANLTPSINNLTSSFNSNNSFNINNKKTFKAELNFLGQTPSLAGSYKLSGFYYFDAGVKMILLNKKIQIAINAIDILKTNKQTYIQFVNNIKQVNYDYADTQKIRFSLTYNFGKSFKTEKREQSNEEEKVRAK